MDDQDLKNVKIPFWIISVMVISTILSLGVLLVILQRDFELDKILYFVLAIILLILFASIFYYIKKVLRRLFNRGKVHNIKNKKTDNFIDNEYYSSISELNSDIVNSEILSEGNNVKLAKKEKTDEYLGGKSRSDIFRY